MSQAENAIKLKFAMIFHLRSKLSKIQENLLSKNFLWNNHTILEISEDDVLIDVIGIKKFNDLTVEDLIKLVSILDTEETSENVMKLIDDIKPTLKAMINKFVNDWVLYEQFSKWFNISQSVNAWVLDKRISAIFSTHIILTDFRNNLAMFKYDELDLLTLSVIYDIISDYSKNIK